MARGTLETEAGRPRGDAAEAGWTPELVERLYALLYATERGGEALDAEIAELRSHYGDTVYSELIYLLSHLRFDADEAKRHWEQILVHRAQMGQRLGAPVDLRVALASYFVQVNRKLQNPKIIELKLFEQTCASAYRDELTGLHNYRLFREFLTQEIMRSEQHNMPLSLVMADVDGFKAFNDRNGHEVANEALAVIARLLAGCQRRGDLAARYGGEEFALILPLSPKTVALEVAEQLRDAVERYTFRTDRGPASLTVSVGIATFPADAREVGELVRLADRAMYAAKAGGKNQVQLYGQSRRSFTRVEAALDGDYRVLVADSHPLTTINVSEKGLCFQTDHALPLGSLVDLRLRIPDTGRTITVCGRVVHVDPRPEGRFLAALRIADMDTPDQEALQTFLRKGTLS